VERDWRQFFDLVIVSACKPAFFEETGTALREVDQVRGPSGFRQHGGALTVLLGLFPPFSLDSLRAARQSSGALKLGQYFGTTAKGRIFAGGSVLHLNALLKTKGKDILYFGGCAFPGEGSRCLLTCRIRPAVYRRPCLWRCAQVQEIVRVAVRLGRDGCRKGMGRRVGPQRCGAFCAAALFWLCRSSSSACLFALGPAWQDPRR
jgi:hypothetical protein